MACQWFEPLNEASSLDRPAPARAPLGKLFEGRCHAAPDAPAIPDPATQYESCNFGYGRTTCPRFPAGADADAVRFTEHAGRLIWILEKQYAPLRHGVVDATTDGLLARQAEVFRKACLNR